MTNRNHFTDILAKRSSSELERILFSSVQADEVKLAAKWILEERGNLPDNVPPEFTKEKSSYNPYPNGFNLLVPKKSYLVTPIILLLNYAVFIVMLTAGVDIYKPEVADIVNWGGNAKVFTLEQGQYWRLVTSIFVHVGVPHLLMNSLGFLFAAAFLEHYLGRRSFIFVYLSTGILASLTSALWYTNMISAGASGAIFGLYGFLLASLVLGSAQERKMNKGLIATIFIFVFYNLAMGLTGKIDNAAHIGGLVAGIILGVLYKMKGRLYQST